MARDFASHIAAHAERLPLSQQQVTDLDNAVEAFRDALARTMWSSSAGPRATSLKNMARAEAEKSIRSVARVLRADPSLTSFDRELLNLPEPARRLKRRECPQIAPVLTFKGSTSQDDSRGEIGGGGRHILEYMNDFDYKRGAKPHGAARLELFVELVPPELVRANLKGVPTHPGQLSGGRLWYLRSFSSSRFEVEFPVMADGTPLLVCYWGRWADAKGAVGPFSKTCVARVEGGPRIAPLYVGTTTPRREMKHVVTQAPYLLSDESAEHRLAMRCSVPEAHLLPSAAMSCGAGQ
jgi:hypothetical protein